MSTLDQEQQIGFRFEVDGDGNGSEETDPIDAVNAKYWKIGERTYRFNDLHPAEKHLWEPLYKTSQLNPYDLQLVSTSLQSGIAFYPVNLIPFYMVLGKHTEAGGIHTITNMLPGEDLPTFTKRSESTGGTVDTVFSGVGCKASSLSGLINLAPGALKTFSQTMTFPGIKNATPTLDEKHTTGAMFPTTSGTMVSANQVQTRFRKDTNFEFVWDTADGGDDIDLLSELISFNYLITNGYIMENVENQAEIEYIDPGEFLFMFTFVLWRGADRSVWDDFLSRTKYKMFLKCYAGATNYMTLTWDKIGLETCDPPYGQKDTKKTWQVYGQSQDFSVLGIDGLHGDAAQTEFYGEATP